MQYHISITEDGVTRYPMHRHAFCEVMFYLQGEGCLRTEQGDIPFESGTAIIVPPQLLHGSALEQGFKNISVGGDFASLLLFDRPVAVSATADSRLLCQLIYENRLSDGAYLQSLVQCYITALLQSCHACAPAHRAVERIIRDISEQALRADFDVTDALHRSGYAEDYIRSQFRRVTGKTPVAFVNTVRVEHACKLMDIYGEALSVTELSEKCGFSDSAYFSRVFKAVKGSSPRRYQQTGGKKKS